MKGSPIFPITGVAISILALSSCTAFRYEQKHPEDLLVNSRYSKFAKYWANGVENDDTIPLEELAWGRKRAIDMAYRDYKEALHGERKKFDMTTSAIINVLAAMISMGDSTFATKEIQTFGVLTAFVKSTQSDVESKLFYDKTIELLIQRMDALRQAAWKKCADHLETSNKQAVFGALDAYVAAGSIHMAFQHLSQEDPSEGLAGDSAGEGREGDRKRTEDRADEKRLRILGL